MVFRDVTLSDIVRFASWIPSDMCVGHTGYDGITMSDINLYVGEYAGFREQTLLKAIQASETRVLAELNDVKNILTS